MSMHYDFVLYYSGVDWARCPEPDFFGLPVWAFYSKLSVFSHVGKVDGGKVAFLRFLCYHHHFYSSTRSQEFVEFNFFLKTDYDIYIYI